MKSYKAFLYDLNGTMIDDMHFHLSAWYQIVHELGSSLSREEVKHEMYGKNQDLLERVFGKGYFTSEKMEEISIKKEHLYQKAYKPHLKLIPGLHQLLEHAKQKGILMAIGSAAIPFNIDFVLDNLQLRHYFNSIVSAMDVQNSKPDPETYLKAAQQLKVTPTDCLVFEDAPKGVEAAFRAGMDCVVLTTMHEPHEFTQYTNIISFVKDYRPLVEVGF